MNSGLMPQVSLPWVFDPVLIGSLVTAAVLYLLLAGPLRSRLTRTERVKPWQALLFMSALIVTFLADGSPLTVPEYADSTDIEPVPPEVGVQHTVISYIVAPLILWGTPGWMVRPFVTNKVVEPIFRTLTRPLVAFLVFSLGFSLWHLPFIYEAALTNDFVHHVQHVIFLVLSLIVWWPLMSSLPELPPLGYGMSIIYLVGLPIGQFFAGALVTFSQVSIYPTYAAAPRITDLGVVEDQVLGGVIMKIASFVVFGIPLIFTFLRWANSESPSRARGRVAISKEVTTGPVPQPKPAGTAMEPATPAETSGHD